MRSPFSPAPSAIIEWRNLELGSVCGVRLAPLPIGSAIDAFIKGRWNIRLDDRPFWLCIAVSLLCQFQMLLGVSIWEARYTDEPKYDSSQRNYWNRHQTLVDEARRIEGLSERERTPLIKGDLAPDVISDHFLRLATLPKKARVLEVRFRSRNALYDDDEATCDAVNRYNLRITIPSLFPPPASIKMSTWDYGRGPKEDGNAFSAWEAIFAKWRKSLHQLGWIIRKLLNSIVPVRDNHILFCSSNCLFWICRAAFGITKQENTLMQCNLIMWIQTACIKCRSRFCQSNGPKQIFSLSLPYR